MSLNVSYLKTIKRVRPMDQQEQNDINYIINWLKSEKKTYRSQNPKEHLCAYFPLINLDRGLMFLVHHRKSGLWLPTGGHVEKGEASQETVVRELKEELGIEYKRKLVPFFIGQIKTVGKTAGHVHNDVWFLIEAGQNTKLYPNKKEFYAWGWFAFKEATKKSQEPNIKRAINKIRFLFQIF